MSREPLLPAVRNPAADAALRDSLRTLRDSAAGEDMRRRIDAVLDGRSSLRDLARDQRFSAWVGPLAQRGWEDYEEMSPEEREELAGTIPPDQERGPDR